MVSTLATISLRLSLAHPIILGCRNWLVSRSQGFATLASIRIRQHRLGMSPASWMLLPVAYQDARFGRETCLLWPRILSSQNRHVNALDRLGAWILVSTLSKTIICEPVNRQEVICFRISSSLLDCFLSLADSPVTTFAISSTSRVAPVPGVGLSNRKRGVGPSITGRTMGVIKAARALAREA